MLYSHTTLDYWGSNSFIMFRFLSIRFDFWREVNKKIHKKKNKAMLMI